MQHSPDPESLVCVGVVTGARGIKGDVVVKSFTDRPEDVAAYGPVDDGKGNGYDIRVVGTRKGQMICRLSGVTDRNAAEALKGTRLHVAKSALPAPDEDEFYCSDLVGLKAETTTGEDLGEVRAVHDFGAGDILELAGGIMVPFTREAVPEVDMEGGKVVIDPPPGLLEPADRPDAGEEAETKE